jgi:hypothetical protein
MTRPHPDPDIERLYLASDLLTRNHLEVQACRLDSARLRLEARLAPPVRPDNVPEGSVPATFWAAPEDARGYCLMFAPDGGAAVWQGSAAHLREHGVTFPEPFHGPYGLSEELTRRFAGEADEATGPVHHTEQIAWMALRDACRAALTEQGRA